MKFNDYMGIGCKHGNDRYSCEECKKDLEEYSTNETESYEELMKQKETLLSNVTIETRDEAIQILTIINKKINNYRGKQLTIINENN